MASNYTGNPTAAQSPSSAPGPGVAPIISIPAGTDVRTIESITQEMKCLADYVAWLTSSSGGAAFGDGSDGDITTSLLLTLTRDMYYNNLTLGAPLISNGYRIFVREALITNGNQIRANGNSATSTSGALGASSGSLAGGANGGAGNVGAGSAASATVASLGGAGGKGGDSGNTGGAGGTATAGASSLGGARAFSAISIGHTCGLSGGATVWTPIGSGAGGGGGAGDGISQSGMGGGGGGGMLAICARSVVLNNAGDLIAAGGAGASGTSTGTTEGGGGGGGGGGVLLLGYGRLTIASGSLSAATNCHGGAGGAGGSNGLAGAAGSNGTVIAMQLG